MRVEGEGVRGEGERREGWRGKECGVEGGRSEGWRRDPAYISTNFGRWSPHAPTIGTATNSRPFYRRQEERHINPLHPAMLYAPNQLNADHRPKLPSKKFKDRSLKGESGTVPFIYKLRKRRGQRWWCVGVGEPAYLSCCRHTCQYYRLAEFIIAG